MKENQISIPMIESFSDKPEIEPLDWVQIGGKAGHFLMDPSNGVLKTDEKGLKYFTAFLEGKSKELITYGCVVLGKILRGDDTDPFLPTLSEFFNREWGLFLNEPGGDLIEYWYLMDVNALADAIIMKKMTDHPEIMEMWKSSTNRLIKLARSLNYDFNAQGYIFGKDSPFTRRNEFRQPDAVAGYAYLMLLAYEAFHEDEYLQETKTAMRIYQDFKTNPWYEIPSGAMACLAAARLNSMGFSFDLNKILNFTFDSDTGSMLAGKYGNSEINGLMIGWRGYSREYATSSAYSMETMIVLPYVLPVARYDARYARAIGKYALHAASNARLFFSDYLPADFQSRPDLKPEIPYEKLCKEHEGHSPYGTGDCEGHKSVYGGGFALWWSAIISQTNEPFIPRFDLTKTDFLEGDAYPTFLYYNPWKEERVLDLDAGTDSTDVYELVLHQQLYKNVNGRVKITVPADSARVVVLVSAGGQKTIENGKLMIDGVVVDHRFKED